MNIEEFQAELKEWVEKNFPRTPEQRIEKDISQFLGVVEEVGELAHALLKEDQGIRGTSNQLGAKQKDAVGDIAIFLINFCNMKGWSFEGILEETWEEVRKRDWVNKPQQGT